MGRPPAEEHVVELRLHGIVLVRPLTKAVAASVVGTAVLLQPWAVSPAGALLLVVGAILALRAVWRWERTQVRISHDRLVVAQGTVRRRTVAVELDHAGPIAVEQGFVGRLCGFGTLRAGGLEIDYVPDLRRLGGPARRWAA
jgi:membrane protein YdbS with pleckstrin-like domain